MVVVVKEASFWYVLLASTFNKYWWSIFYIIHRLWLLFQSLYSLVHFITSVSLPTHFTCPYCRKWAICLFFFVLIEPRRGLANLHRLLTWHLHRVHYMQIQIYCWICYWILFLPRKYFYCFVSVFFYLKFTESCHKFFLWSLRTMYCGFLPALYVYQFVSESDVWYAFDAPGSTSHIRPLYTSHSVATKCSIESEWGKVRCRWT